MLRGHICARVLTGTWAEGEASDVQAPFAGISYVAFGSWAYLESLHYHSWKQNRTTTETIFEIRFVAAKTLPLHTTSNVGLFTYHPLSIVEVSSPFASFLIWWMVVSTVLNYSRKLVFTLRLNNFGIFIPLFSSCGGQIIPKMSPSRVLYDSNALPIDMQLDYFSSKSILKHRLVNYFVNFST